MADSCYGCGGVLVPLPEGNGPKHRKGHVLAYCPDKACADEWAAGYEHVIQCLTCGRFWGQVP